MRVLLYIITLLLFSTSSFAASSVENKAAKFKRLLATAVPSGHLIIGDERIAHFPKLDNTYLASVEGSSVRTWTQYAKGFVEKVRPDYVLIIIGLHDARDNAKATTWSERLEALCSILSSRGAKIILSTIPPVRGGPASSSAIRQFNEQISLISIKHGYGFIDSWKALVDKNGKLSVEYAEANGELLNTNGLARWLTLLYKGE